VHPSAVVSPCARLDPTASVGALCSVGARAVIGARSRLAAGVVLYEDAEVGVDCVLHAHCVLREGTRLGDRVVLHPGVVLGADGFAYVGNERAELEKVPQLGRVVIEDDVEIGAHSAVDRGSLGETRIGRGSKIDNLVQIGHNCRLAENVIVVSQAGLAGSTRVERGAIVMAQAGAAGHLTIGAGALVGPQAGVRKDVEPGARVYGSPARGRSVHYRLMAALPRLPQLLRRVRAIERRLGLAVPEEGADGAAGDG
jgi:UDP-3-O-[3-hydroxymyristoyl] glucosamine N-acyltransferase